MEEILTKLFDKWFKYKIKKEWLGKIQAEKYTEEQEKRLAKDMVTAVNDSIDDILGKIKEELDTSYWLVDTTIQDTMDNIQEEEREKEEKLEDEEQVWSSDDDGLKAGDSVICSYEKKEECTCIHKKEHLYDPSSCSFVCAYNEEGCEERAKCVAVENESELDEDTKEIVENGGL